MHQANRMHHDARWCAVPRSAALRIILRCEISAAMKRLTINLPDDLAEILTEVQRREGYRSPSECVISFIQHWALSQQPHTLTARWAALPGPERDQLNSELLALVKSGKGQKGSLLKRWIYDAIKEINGPAAKTPTVDEVLSRLPDTILKSLEK